MLRFSLSNPETFWACLSTESKKVGFGIILEFGYCSWVYFCLTNLFSQYVKKVWVLLKFFKIQKLRLRRLTLARNSFESFAWEQVAVLHATGSLWGLYVNQTQAAPVQPKPTLLRFTARTLFMKQREGGFSVPRGLVKIHQEFSPHMLSVESRRHRLTPITLLFILY